MLPHKMGVIRFRFSLRGVLVAATVCAVLLYLGVARPTMLANRLVAAANAQDMDAVDALVAEKDWREEDEGGLPRDRATRRDHIYADLFPRDWSDWLGCRRRIVLRIARHRDTNGQHVEWTQDIDFVSSATGIRVSPPDHHF
jgi:hypothetical protein